MEDDKSELDPAGETYINKFKTTEVVESNHLLSGVEVIVGTVDIR